MTGGRGGAIAVFVKTPGVSPIKTRLAQSIGKDSAERFHLLAARCIESVIDELRDLRPDVTPYWAVAEKLGLSYPAWDNFDSIFQGEGSLGERLSLVYDHLLEKHSFVIFVGADSPQLSSTRLIQAIESLIKFSFVIGPAEDGGFYLFGGKTPIPRQSWLNVTYSSDRTYRLLAENLRKLGSIDELPSLVDIDTFSDLQRLINQDHREDKLTSKQKALFDWAKDVVLKQGHEKG